MPDMNATLADLEARLARMEDREEIRRLKARYLRACDLKQPDVVKDCFLPTGVRIAYEGFPEFTSRDAFVAMFRQAACQGGVYDLHHASNADIDLVDVDTAYGKLSLQFQTILLAMRQVTRLSVEYDDVYRRSEGRWWIAETSTRITSRLTGEIGQDGEFRVLDYGGGTVC